MRPVAPWRRASPNVRLPALASRFSSLRLSHSGPPLMSAFASAGHYVSGAFQALMMPVRSGQRLTSAAWGLSDPAAEAPVVGHLPGFKKARHGHDTAQPVMAQLPSSSRALGRFAHCGATGNQTPGAPELPRCGRTRSASRLATSTPSITRATARSP